MAEVKATTKLDSRGFEVGTKKMKKSVFSLNSALKGMKGTLIATFSVAAIKAFAGSVIGAAAAIEDLTIQFKVLFFSSDLAIKRMEDLKKFSAQTPFQLEDIAGASQTLEVFSEGLLGGVKDLKLFGDAAAATGNTDLKNMSFWVGRLFAALESGRPFIDSANALSRLKVLGPTTIKTMIDMSEAGKDGADIWNVFTESLKKFEGGMEQLEKTTSGKTSTMRDNWRLAFADMGERVEGFTKTAIGALTKLAQFIPKALDKGSELEAFKRSLFTEPIDTLFGGGSKRKGRQEQEEAQALANASNAMLKEQEKQDKAIAAREARTAARKKAKRDAELQAEEDALDKLSDKVAKNADKALMEKERAAEKEADKETKLAEDVEKAKKRFKGIESSAAGVDADRIARIGGTLGGAVSPALQLARQNLDLDKKRNDFLQNLAPEIRKAIEESGGLG
jgi:hypothetical protein